MVDIDDFKKANDTYGHNTGHAVLRIVAQRLISNCRDYDAVGRWGGEEFLLVIDSDEQQVVKNVAERMRLAVCNSPVSYEQNILNITITLGMIVFTSVDELTPEQLVGKADELLYKGKIAGKNRVVC